MNKSIENDTGTYGRRSDPDANAGIEFFFHCKKCIAEHLPPNISVGVLPGGEVVRIWCRNHEIPMANFTLANPMRDLSCVACAEGLPHEH